MADFFDDSFLSELEELAGLAAGGKGAVPAAAPSAQLATFLDREPGPGQGASLTEDEFVALPTHGLTARVNLLLDLCREGGKPDAVQAVDNFVVFFRALIPTLPEGGSAQIKRVFFRLVPTLIHIAYNDFGDDAEKRQEGREALRNLERVLIEISGVRLAPAESDLVFRSIDQITAFVAVGEYAMADQVVSSRLLSLIARNKVLRALFRVMEAEVGVQRYLKERLGYSTPELRLPGDIEALADYAPMRIFEEEGLDGTYHRFIQVQLPDLHDPSAVVLHVTSKDTGQVWELGLDALGSSPLDLPDGVYTLGLVYVPRGT